MSPTAGAYANYASSSVATAGPNEVVRMAYDRILTACNRAETVFEAPSAGWLETFHSECVRAEDILVELAGMLATEHDDEAVAELAGQLYGLYGFCHARLVEANVMKDAAPLAAVRATIADLRAAWSEGVCLR
jgi:flagellar biosynthetic protein FliS